MGSNVLPYFILTAEKVTDLREIEELKREELLQSYRGGSKSPPVTPVPSGVSNQTEDTITTVKRSKKKGIVKYKIPVKAIRKRASLNHRMELIKEKLEKSRERFQQKKTILGDPDFKCEPTVIGLNGTGSDVPYGLDRSVSDLTGVKGKRNTDGTFPYVYFVVSENKLSSVEENFIMDNGETFPSKSADKKKRVKIVEESKLKRDKKEQMAKMQGLARELGLKSVIDPKPPESKSKSYASVNQIVFPDTLSEHVHTKHGNELPTTKSNLHSIHHSPTRVPPGTPATYLSETKFGDSIPASSDVDETVPRKPFLSGPLYSGKVRGVHACSMPTFELPMISPEQKRRALGLGTSARFDEFAYPKPKSEQRNRKVSFADQLPVIRGSGFALSGNDPRDDFGQELLGLGPRAATMGSITLPSEKVDRQSLCQKFLLGENVSSARNMRRNGVPLPLPKIDIVSNVYDEMIIKMIQEYLQVSNTPTRQSQLAKELLVNLQKHSDNINVPMSKEKRELATRTEGESGHDLHRKSRYALFKERDIHPPPNTAEAKREPKQMLPQKEEVIDTPVAEPLDKQDDKEEDTVPVVEITFKTKEECEDNGDTQLNEENDTENQLPKSAKSGRGLKSRERPTLSPITPVSFQMAPPGLSKEDTNLSISMMS